MFWVIVAIIAAAWIIASAIKKSMWDANATPEQKTAVYNARVQAAQAQSIRQLCMAIYEQCRRGKSNKQIAGNAKVQKHALAAGIDITGEDTVREIKRDVNFLAIIGYLDKFKAMVASGESDEKIAKKLGRQYEGYLMYKCYDPDDIAYMRETILGHKTTKQHSLVQSDWSSFNEQLDGGKQ